ncbi:MAG: hydantoinase/oxoprolinase family protein [Oscillospiraceae bacterium]|nr:hydantoinase/oxoprolinase family protein [Oscillospiraceae bacterium]
MKIGIGIDTGGTYTDAVAYDFSSGQILGSAKSPTTKEDLSIGILGALDALPKDLAQKAELVSLSTTLATNACVEGRGGKAKLIFFGGDKKVIDENGKKYGLPLAEDMYIQESHTDFYGGAKQDVDWELFLKNAKTEFEDLDGVGIIEKNAARNGGSVEKKAKKLFMAEQNVPVVCGNELFSELNCLQRGSSTLLNAGLFCVIKEFLDAIKLALKKRNIKATVVIVRSDGSLMSEEFASVRPVETLLCGPAASAVGAARLSGEPDCVVVDMGGTTTDIALIRGGAPVFVTEGVSVGKWRTFVSGLYVKTFGLGGDSAVHYRGEELILEEYRVTPLCIAAHKYPKILENLKKLLADPERRHTKYLHEHYIASKDISKSPRYTAEEKVFCEALKKNGPLMLKEAAEAVGKDVYTLNVSKLVKEGAVQQCGLTPTDLMHIKGDFDKYSTPAAMLGARFVAQNLGISVKKLCEAVYAEIKRKIYSNVVLALFECGDPNFAKNGAGPETMRFIDASFEAASSDKKRGLVFAEFKSELALVGLGAPIHIFLNDVAKMLGTRAKIPQYYEVANAIGAIAGNICVTYSVEIRPNYSAAGITGYTVYGPEVKTFEELSKAEDFAVSAAKEAALAEAKMRGAKGEISLVCELAAKEARAKNAEVHLKTVATAQAVGAAGF